MTRRLSLLFLIALLSACGSGSSATSGTSRKTDVEPQTARARYGGDSGESAVGAIPQGVLHDAARNRDVAISVDYPTRPGPHPLLVFSHAYGTGSREYVGLSAYWASQGYVVVRPSHADFGRAAMATAQDESSQTAADWRERVKDVVLVLDQLDQLEQSYPELKGKIDRARIGVAGHAYGAFTAMLVAGARTFPGAASYADPRVKAVVLMGAPDVAPAWGLTPESWSTLRIPALLIAGTRPGETAGERADAARRTFEALPAGDKWLALIEGATSGTFTGVRDRFGTEERVLSTPETNNPMNPIPRPQVDPNRPGRENSAAMGERGRFNNVKVLSLAFFDTYLGVGAEGREGLENAGHRGGVELVKK